MSNRTYTKKKIGGDSIDLFLVFQVERETVMTYSILISLWYGSCPANRNGDSILESVDGNQVGKG